MTAPPLDSSNLEESSNTSSETAPSLKSPLDLTALRAEIARDEPFASIGVDTVLALLDRVEAAEGWEVVYPCKLTRDEPFDFGQCETHDRTFPLGGTCDHTGKSEIDWMSDRESEQRVRAMRAEDRAEAAEAKVAAVREVHQPKSWTRSVPTFDEYDSPWERVNGCTCGERLHPCPTIRALDGGA